MRNREITLLDLMALRIRIVVICAVNARILGQIIL